MSAPDFTDFPGPSGDGQPSILDAVERYIRRFVVLTDHQAAAVVLWIAHVFVFAAATSTPYLWISSATPRSGKSRLLEVVEAILGELRAVFTMNISPSALYRMVDANPGMAVLVDESDRLLRGDKERASEIIGLIDSGFRRRGGYAIRNVGQGANLKPARFATFSPKAIAGIGTLADTVADRSIPIRMRRRLPSERIERFRERDAEDAQPLRGALESWATPEQIAALAAARPEIPETLNDRAQDGWELLIGIADAVGGVWPARAREAAVALAGIIEQIAEESLELLALRHVSDAFESSGADRLATTTILEALIDRDDGPWAEWWGRAVAEGRAKAPARRLGTLLGAFGIAPAKIRVGDGVFRGYMREWLGDAVERHLPLGNGTHGTNGTPLASTVPLVPLVPLGNGMAAPPPPLEMLSSLASYWEWRDLKIGESTIGPGEVAWSAWLAAAAPADRALALEAFERLEEAS